MKSSAGSTADLLILMAGLSVAGCSDASVPAGPGGAPEACVEFAERQGYDAEWALFTEEIRPDGTVQVVVSLGPETRGLVCYTKLDRGAWWLIGFSGVQWPVGSGPAA